MNKHTKTLYILSGAPGSGKTTYARKLSEQHNAVVHSYDEMPGANTRASMDGSVKKAWIETIRSDLMSGNSVVCDGLFLTSKDRKEMLEEFSDISCQKIIIVLSTPLEICLERNRNRQARLPDFVVKQAYERYETPQYNENWDEIVFL